ncbi:hypothetical protein [Photobacterium kishitanii]|uniref:Uncharacterized protein n=1 Tax=Photobacterium kishitanii TaxID=318456 RepID=A0A2T3KMS7_9GAMM|nr:hypothetical protein [Photobacterium kishitanii]PSV01082.1 hypothetical protein C9J27_03425 [Photobacterium kishitanii]
MKYSKSVIVLTVACLLSSTGAYAANTTNSELDALLSENPVSQDDMAAFEGALPTESVKISTIEKVHSDISNKPDFKEVVPLDKKAETDVVNTLSVSDQTPVPALTNGDLYLINIPTGSYIKMKKDLYIVPNDSVFFFKDGKRVYENPFHSNKYETFCMLRLTESASARRMKESSSYVIKGVESKIFDKKMGFDADRHIQLIKMPIDNDNLRQIVCYSGEMKEPMTISDMTNVMGDAFSVNLQMYKDI